MKNAPVCKISLWLIIVISLINWVIFTFTPFSGDDWVYKGAFEGPCTYASSWVSFPRWVIGHWLYTNGRIFNLILPVLLALPKWLVGAICAAMLLLMYRAILLIVPDVAKTGITSVLLITCIAIGLPWWDAMTVFACEVNYVWAAAMVLMAFYFIAFHSPTRSLHSVIATVVCFFGGAAHEAASMPLCVGLAVFFALERKELIGIRRRYFVAFALGTAFVTLCPGIIFRAVTKVEPDDPLIPLALKTVPAVLIMIAIFLALSCKRCGRRYLVTLLHRPAVALAIAAVISGAVSLASGIVGRSGWFAELFAISVIFTMIGDIWHPRGVIARMLAYALALVVIAQVALVAAWQYWLGREADMLESLYACSDGSLVFMDYTSDNKVPLALLGRFKGVPDADDVYLLRCFADYHHPSSPLPVILPRDAAGLDFNSIDKAVLSDGSEITTTLPAGVCLHSTERENIGFYTFMRDGNQWVAREFEADGRILFHLSPRIIDPGDR